MVNEDDDKKKSQPAAGGKSRKWIYMVLIVVLFMFWRKGASTETDVEEGSPKQKSGKKKDSQTSDSNLEGVDIIQSSSKLGWDVYNSLLVDKRTPRECAIKRLDAQVLNPIAYRTKKGWMRRAYACGKHGKCRSSLIQDFEDRRWKAIAKGMDATFIMTNLETLENLRIKAADKFEKVYFAREGVTYLDAIVGSESLAGNPVEQFTRRDDFAHQHGCRMIELNFTPKQYRIDQWKDCAAFEKQISSDRRSKWVNQVYELSSGEYKSSMFQGGDGSICTKDFRGQHVVMTGSIDAPLTVHKTRFAVRSYMLIGSTLPFMAFFRRGYIRRESSSNKHTEPILANDIDLSGEPMSLDKFQEHLAFSKTTGAHYVDTFLQASMKKIALFVFHAARRSLHRRRGSYQLIAIDYFIDESFRVYLGNTEAYPELANIPSFDMLGMVAEMHDLVQELQEVPVAFETMVPGDKYGQWEMIFSELQESCSRIVYNPCHAFLDFNGRDLRKFNVKVGKIHNTETRYRHAVVDRINKQNEINKKAMCSEAKLSYPSTRCDRAYQAADDAEFAKAFAQHEKSFNPNDFSFRKPGEILPWDKV